MMESKKRDVKPSKWDLKLENNLHVPFAKTGRSGDKYLRII